MEVERIRCFSELKADKFDDEKEKTATSKEQIKTEGLIERCFDRFEQLSALDPNLPNLLRTEHARLLEASLHGLSTAYECLDSSRPWLVYWILNAANLLNVKFTDQLMSNTVDFLVKCRCPDGGFAGGPGQYAHLAPTYAAVNALCIIGTEKALNAINRRTLKKFLHAVREPNGAFRMHVDGELDVRGAYCAISSAKLSNFSRADEAELFKGTVDWIAECQTYEGGFGGTPDLEAHGGYSFCAIAAIAILGGDYKIDLDALLRWAVNRQMKYEGGFQGRTNKLVDACYSFWQGAVVPITQALISKRDKRPEIMDNSLFNREALQEYVLICCQRPGGGLIDKPMKPADLYHTCYALSGVSVSQHCEINKPPLVIGNPENELLPTHPIHNVPPKCVMDAYKFFLKNEMMEEEAAEEMKMNGHEAAAGSLPPDVEMREGSVESSTSSSATSDRTSSSYSETEDEDISEASGATTASKTSSKASSISKTHSSEKLSKTSTKSDIQDADEDAKENDLVDIEMENEKPVVENASLQKPKVGEEIKETETETLTENSSNTEATENNIELPPAINQPLSDKEKEKEEAIEQ